MKRKIPLLFLLFLFGVIALQAQTIQVNGKKFQTVSKIVLNQKTEFYQLKQKGVANAEVKNYIKSGGEYYKTILKAEELKELITKGTISSLGTVSERKIGKNKIYYIDKSSVIIIFYFTKDVVQLMEIEMSSQEFAKEMDDVAALDNEPGTTDTLEKCYTRCEIAFDYSTYQGRYELFKCRIGCRKKFKSGSTQAMQEYSVSCNQVIQL